MTSRMFRAAGMAGAAAVIAAALPCAALAAKPPLKRVQKARVAEVPTERIRAAGLTPFNPPLIDSARFTFTAPGRGASTARMDSVERAFRFTPSGQPARKALTIGVASNVVAPARDATRTAETASVAPVAYNVGLSLGWRGFGVTGGYSRLDTPVSSLGPSRRDAVDLAISYRARNWRTALQVAAETGSPLLLTPTPERRYSADFGAAYALSPRLELSGGVRYKVAPLSPTLTDPTRDDQAVYLGTAFSF